jgi:hypothetical protein
MRGNGHAENELLRRKSSLRRIVGKKISPLVDNGIKTIIVTNFSTDTMVGGSGASGAVPDLQHQRHDQPPDYLSVKQKVRVSRLEGALQTEPPELIMSISIGAMQMPLCVGPLMCIFSTGFQVAHFLLSQLPTRFPPSLAPLDQAVTSLKKWQFDRSLATDTTKLTVITHLMK